MKPTAIVTFHTNPYTCGVARFNIALAESLDVHIPKGYVYFAMAFSLAVEVLNIRARQKKGG